MNKDDFLIESKKAQFMVSNAMTDITKATRKVLQDYVHNQYLVSFAKVIAYLGTESEESLELLAEMDFETREKVRNLAADFNKHDEAVTKEVEHIVTTSGINIQPDFQIIKEYLLKTGNSFVDSVVHDFKEETPIFKRQLEDCIFNFEDIKYLTDRDIQKILRETDQVTLATALKGVDTEIQDKFFCNMSTRAATMLKEDMEFMGPVPISEVEKCQVSIVQTIFRLAESNQIVLTYLSGIEELVD